MDYVFCGAYAALFFALHLKKMGKKITIITHNKNIIKYCKAEKIDYIKYNQIIITGWSFYKVFALKQNSDKLIEKINFCKKDRFFLLGNRKQFDAFYLSKELSKKGVVYYYSMSILTKNRIYKPPVCKPVFIRGEISRIVLKLFMDIDIVYYQVHGVPVIGVDNKFLKKHDIREYEIDLSPEDILFNLVNKNKTNYEEFENLLVDEGPIIKIVKRDSLIELYENLLKLPIKFAFKLHPTQLRRTSDAAFYDIFKSCNKIPEYIPIELFFNNVKKNVISGYSTSLVTASKFEHLKAISLLELVEWYDDSFKKDIKRGLIERSKNKILFPNTFNELKEIINEPRKK